MRSLSWKLAGALLLIVLVSIGLMAFLANQSTAREFNQYLAQGNTLYAQNVANNLSQFYSRQQNWSGVQSILSDFLRFQGDRIAVADSSGVVAGDTAGQWLGQSAKRIGLSNGIPVTVSGREVGQVYLFTSGMGMMGRGGLGSMMMTSAEQDFLSRINRSLWLTGLIAAAVALVLGLLLALQITRPVRALTKGARHIAHGELSYRVNIKAKDELGELAQTFNSMAAGLEKNEQSRRRLTADIAHELRTPLTIIEGTVDGILDGVFPPDREHLDSIKEQTLLLTRLIGDLRDLSLAEAGQLKLELAPTNLTELIKRKLSQVEVSAIEMGVQLKLNASGKIPEVSVDATRMEQVIANLLTNALRHTANGGSITVSLDTVNSDKEHYLRPPGVLISVTDTGEGIAPEHLPHVFERFYRVEDSRSRSEGGTGLGLAIVKQMVEAHSGKVWVESEVGKGSTFYVAIPVTGSI